MMKSLSKTILIFCIIFLASCVDFREQSYNIAHLGLMEEKIIKTDRFLIHSYQKIQDPSSPYVIYIEGDGVVFTSGRVLSKDPTPYKSMLLKFAALDSRPNVIYLSRPCQYTVKIDSLCEQKYWAHDRNSSAVVESLNQAIAIITQNSHKVDLIGYSGGGGIAIVIAAMNHKIRSIITMAGNLDYELFLFHQKHTKPFVDAINPIDVATKISHIPQIHYLGSDDTIITQDILMNFVTHSASFCVKYKILEDVSHWDGWFNYRNEIMNHIPSCF